MLLFLTYEDQTDFDGILNQLQEAENVDHIGKIYDNFFLHFRDGAELHLEILRLCEV